MTTRDEPHMARLLSMSRAQGTGNSAADGDTHCTYQPRWCRLSGLDSGALAALLKELAKGGLVKRAVEIFDWLRSLDERSDLGCLCDVYTCEPFLRPPASLVNNSWPRKVRGSTAAQWQP